MQPKWSYKSFALGLLLGMAVLGTVAAAPKLNGSATVGRFQLHGNHDHAMVIDTFSGQIWFQKDADFQAPKLDVPPNR